MSGKILPLFLAYHQMVRQVIRDLLRSLFGAVLGNRSSGGAITLRLFPMQKDIHPKYEAIKATWSCGNVVETRSTLCKDMHIDTCSACHPFYTGKQKNIDVGGRIDRFNKRFGARTTK
jgi:large subunit ribosomal protein L31